MYTLVFTFCEFNVGFSGHTFSELGSETVGFAEGNFLVRTLD